MAEKKIEEEQTKALVKPTVHDEGQFAVLMDSERFDHLWRVATLYSKTRLIPQHFQGKPEDCFIALEMSMRLEVDPMTFMQKCYVIGGKASIETQLAIALINRNGPFEGPIDWEMTGEEGTMKRSATAYAVHRITKKRCEMSCSMALAKAEGWLDKSGSKWKTMPELMLRYRSAMFLARLYAPEAILGMKTSDEAQDIAVIDVKPEPEDMMPKAIEEPKAERPHSPDRPGNPPQSGPDKTAADKTEEWVHGDPSPEEQKQIQQQELREEAESHQESESQGRLA